MQIFSARRLTRARLGLRWLRRALVLALAFSSSADAQTLNFGGVTLTYLTPGPVVRMTGSATDLPIGQEADFKAYVQGIEGTKTTIGAGTFTFYVDVDVDSSTVYGRFYSQPFRLAFPIVAELFQISTATVVDREKTFVWDLRRDDEVSIGESAPSLSSLATQITSRGVDRLEPTFLSTLPRPDTATLNERLTNGYTQPHQDFFTDTAYFSSPKACIPMERAASELENTFEFNALRLAAGVQYGAYLAAKSAGLPAAQFCVKSADFFKPKHWEVCVGRLDADLTSVELTGGVRAVDLAIDASGLTSAVTLGPITQNIDVTLRDVSIRWKDNPFCLLRAAVTANVAETTITSDPAIDEWATCRSMNARAGSATTATPIGLPLEYTAVPEQFDVRDAGNVPFDIPPAARTPRNPTGTCRQSFLRPSARSLLEEYYDPLETTLRFEWLEDSPNSEFAHAADLLLSPVEHGTFDTPLDLDIQSNVFLMGTLQAPALPGDPPQPVDGLWFWQSTEAEVKPEYTVATPPPSFVVPPLGPIPWSDDGWSNHSVFPVPFDLAFSTTTVALNQVLRERSATDLMHFTVPVVAGAPTLGDVFALVNPGALAPLTSPTVEWRVVPTVAPFTWMPPDPPFFPGLAPIVYHLPDLILDAVEPGVAGADDTLLLRLKLDFLDPSLGLALSETLGDTFLVPTISPNALFVATIAESHLPGCPMALHTLTYVTTCDRQLEALASLVLRPLVNDRLELLLSEYPGPQFFDAQGEATAPVQLINLRSFQDRNWITLYAEIPPP